MLKVSVVPEIVMTLHARANLTLYIANVGCEETLSCMTL